MSDGRTIVGASRLIVVVGPSGAGKDSILRAWLAGMPAGERVHLARRCITRPAHPGSENHEPISEEGFVQARDAGAFAFHWSAHGLHYGIRHTELAGLADGRWVVMNGSRSHLSWLREWAADAHVVAIDAPAELRRKRLGERDREAATAVAERLQRGAPELAADLTILNDGPLSEAVSALHRWWHAMRAMETA